MDGDQRPYAPRPGGGPGSASGAVVFGCFRLDLKRRILSADGEEVALQPRAFDMLELFVTSRGRVLSGDEIVGHVWRGVAVGENNLGVQLSALRRALAAHGGKGLIVTLPGRGYRFVGEAVGEAEAEAEARSPPQPPRSTRPRRAAAVALLIGIAAAAAAIAAWRLVGPTSGSPAQPRWTVQSSRRLPPSPGGDADPRISPDGSMLAYVAGEPGGRGRVFVRGLPTGAPAAVSPPDEDAFSPAWASDGARLAYVVADPQGEPCRIMVTAFPGGTPRQAGRCRRSPDADIAWQPGSPVLFFDEVQNPPFGRAIWRLDVDTGGIDQVTAPITTEEDLAPRVSPDGAWLAYIRYHGFGGRVLRLHGIAGGEEREIACDRDVESFDWTADSQGLIATVPGQGGGEIVVYPVDGAPGQRVYSTSSSLGKLATGPGGLIAAEVSERRTSLARASAAPRAAADVIDPAPGVTDWPAFSPDGRLAFVSDRSGETALWVREPGAAPVPVVRAGQKHMERPVWSPDGSRIAFFEVWKGEIVVRVVTAGGDEVVSFQVPSIGFGLPSWTPDGEHLVLFDKRILQPVRVDLRDPRRREPIESKLDDGITYHDGATYSVSAFKPGIFRLDGASRLVTSNYPTERRAHLTFLGDDVLLLGPRDGGDLRILAQPLDGGPPRPAFHAPAAEPDTPLAADPTTGEVVYVSAVGTDDHVDLLTASKE